MRCSRSASRKAVPASPAAPCASASGPRTLFLVVALLSTLSTGCSTWRQYFANGLKVGPNYSRPAAPVADQWIDASDPALSTGQIHDVAWWQTFRDPVLDSLVDAAYRQNLTLRVAGLRILEARAQRAIAAGELFPQAQEAFGDYRRFGFSRNGPNGTASELYFSQWTTGASLAWELDFWGRFRRAIEAADANLDASVENYDHVLVLLLADVAQSYTNVRIAEQRLAYAQKNLEIQRGSLLLAQNRFDEGKVTKLDVTDGLSNVAQTEANICPLESARRQAVNQLCTLMGIPPQNLDGMLAGHRGIPSAPAQVAVGIPAELLRRRPDVRRAERQVAAQSALIGIATSELYPHFSINGTIFLDAKKFADLFDADSVAGNVGPSFRWNILHYGRLANNIRVQESRFQQLAVQYQNVVLQANAEAENAMISFLKAQQQVRSLTESTDAAQQSLRLVSLLYRAGKADFSRVFIVQEFLTRQQDQLVIAQGAVTQSLIQLYRALGGGWQIRLSYITSPPPAAPAQPPEVLPRPDAAPAPPLPPGMEQPLTRPTAVPLVRPL